MNRPTSQGCRQGVAKGRLQLSRGLRGGTELGPYFIVCIGLGILSDGFVQSPSKAVNGPEAKVVCMF